MFIAYSLGDIIVKRVLVEAKFDDSYKSIRETIYKIIFFSIFYQENNFTKLGNIAASIIKSILRNPLNIFIKTLKKDLLFSNILIKDFRHQLKDYYVLSFFKTLLIGRLGLIRIKAYILDNLG